MPLFYLVPARQDGGIRQYLRSWGRDFADRMRILPYEELPAALTLAPGTYILSAIDQLGPAMLRLVRELRLEVGDRPGFRFLNDPRSTLLRFELLEELHRRGLNAFRIVRARGDLAGLRFPVFLRSERGHDGAISPLLESRAKIEEAIGRGLLRGRRLDDLLVVEFCPTADRFGTYRKYAAFRVGDRIVPRHMTSGGDWMLKYGVEEPAPEIMNEEIEYVRTNPHRESLQRIFDVAGVQYGRIDYSLAEDRVQTWEINLNPVIGLPLPPDHRRGKNEIFYPAFAEALEAAEGARASGPPHRLAIDRGTREAALAECARSARARPSLLGRPLPAWLDPLAAPSSRWVGKLARKLSAD